MSGQRCSLTRSRTAPGSTVAEREMGNIARDRGDVAGALQHYTVYLRTDPPDKEQVQAEIDKLQGK